MSGYRDPPYLTAHPRSGLGRDVLAARKRGWDFCVFVPNGGDGLMVFRRRGWLVRLLRRFGL